MTQIKDWHDRAKKHLIAHRKIGLRDRILGVSIAVLTGVLGVFSGTAWTADIAGAGAPSDVVKWAAAVAGFAVAVLVAVDKKADFAGASQAHRKDSEPFNRIVTNIEKDMADGRFKTGMTQQEIDAIGDAYDAAIDNEKLDAGDHLLAKAKREVVDERWGDAMIARLTG
jgi:hypothetical protein